MEDQDLLEIGILNSGHRQRILQAIQLLPKVSNALLASPSRQSQWFTSRYSSSVTISDIPTYWCNSPKEVFVGSAKQSDSQDCYGPYSAFHLSERMRYRKHHWPGGQLQSFSLVGVLVSVQMPLQAPQVTAQVQEDKTNIG